MENYEKKYKSALEWIRSIYPTMQGADKEDAEHYFPELKEGEDERIRKEIINYFKCQSRDEPSRKDIHDKWIAWLEKQGEQNHTDKVEPKFKIGDWVQIDGGHVMKILDVRKYVLCYRILNWCGNESVRKISDIDSIAHLWTIQDAEDGDVLASNRSIFIFSQEYMAGKPEAHCGIMNGHFIMKPEGCWTNEKCYPATKEQCDLLFQKMKDAGYEWDSEKKELRKIEQQSSDKAEPTEHNYITANPEFFQWIYDRLKYVYNENPNVDYMLSLKERIEDMQKPIEQDTEIHDLWVYIREWNDKFGRLPVDEDELEACIDYVMKRQKTADKIEPKSAWSEEDERILNKIQDNLREFYVDKKGYPYVAEPDSPEMMEKNWLQSFKDRVQPNHWKPSEEQMKALNTAVAVFRGLQGTYPIKDIESLYNDLKKL